MHITWQWMNQYKRRKLASSYKQEQILVGHKFQESNV